MSYPISRVDSSFITVDLLLNSKVLVNDLETHFLSLYSFLTGSSGLATGKTFFDSILFYILGETVSD